MRIAMYEHIKALARYILDSGRGSFSLQELFEVVTGRDRTHMGKRSDRHIGRILGGLGFSVTIESDKEGVKIRVEPVTPPLNREMILKRAGDMEWTRYIKRGELPPRYYITAYQNLPHILRQIEVMGRKGLPVSEQDLEKLCRLAGYPLKKSSIKGS